MTVRIARRQAGRLAAVAVLALLALAVTVGMPTFSGATYVSSSRATATVTAANDWTPPSVTVRAPGATVQGVVTFVADASDARSGIRDVAVQVSGPSGGWTTVCTTSASPYTCSWDTRAVVDGSWSVRAVATDGAGYTATSATVTTTVTNNVLVVLAHPGDVVRGTVPLTAVLHGTGTTAYSVRIEYTPAGTTSWRTICTRSAAPYTCDWGTTTVANQDYDLRAVATAGSTTHVSALVEDVLVDNAAPSVTLQDPGSPLRGTVLLTSTATDAHSGVERVVVQYAPSGTTSFAELCTATNEPWSCSYNTTRLKDGTYTFRAVATDVAGNTTTSATVTNRAVDNTVSSVSLADPGPYVGGTVTLSVAANSTAGVTSVRIQRSVSGAGSWTDICTDTASPYSCAWDTTSVTDGLYDLRAVLTDGTGKVTTSGVVSARRVDNNPVRGLDVQTISGGATAGKIDNGDRMTFLYSEELKLSTVAPGWAGAPVAVTLRVRDGNLLNLGNKGDTVDVLLNGSVVNIGSVNFKEDYVKSGKTALFSATLSAVTIIVGGVPATQLNVSIGALTSGSNPRTVNLASAMAWTPSTAATDLAGRTVSGALVAESGAPDREF